MTLSPVPAGPQRARLLALLAAATLPLLLLAVWNLWREINSRTEQITAERMALARIAAGTVESVLEYNASTIHTLAQMPGIRQPSAGQLQTLIAGATRVNPELEFISLFDDQGWNISGTVTPPYTLNILDRPYFQTALAGLPSVSDVMIGRGRNMPVVTFAAPVLLEEDRRGVLAGTMSLSYLAERLTRAVPDPLLHVVVVDARGTVVVHRDPAVVESLASWRERSPVAEALAGGAGAQTVRDDAEGEILVAYAPVAGVGWGVLVQQPVSAAYGAMRQDTFVATAILAGLFAFIAAFGWLASGRVVSAYQREAEARTAAERLNHVLQQSVRARSEALEALQRVMETRDDFLAAAAHDLKNPVASARGIAQLLSRSLQAGRLDPARLSAGLVSIEAAADEMASLIDELMDLARLHMDRPLDLDLSAVELISLVQRVAAEYRASVERHEIAVTAAEKQFIGQWDARRLERVVSNLLQNAVKYSPDGGPIKVAIQRDPSSDRRVLLKVQDCGMGIPTADLPHIFERFHRGSNVVGRVPGTGIGLAAVRQIVEQHGGSIEITSVEGEGTAVFVRLPLAEQ